MQAGRVRRFFAWLTRDKRDDDPNRPDWQALVDAVDLAANIADPDWHREHVIRFRHDAQAIADFYAYSTLVDAADGELFALEAALAEYPDDFLGRRGAVRRYDYILEAHRAG